MDDVSLTEAGRYTNVLVGDEMVASYDADSGEFAVYDPETADEEPLTVVETGGEADGEV